MTTKICPNCGFQNDGEANICTSCGHTLEQEVPLQTTQVLFSNTQPAQPFYQTFNQPVTEMPNERRRIPLFIKILGGFACFVIVIVIIAAFITGNVAKADFYKIGSDQIPSVKLVLGEERKVTGTSTSTSNGITTNIIEYQVPGGNQNKDMIQYFNYLMNNDGFLPLVDIDFNGPSGTGEFGRNSIESGKAVIMQINYDLNGYTIKIDRGEGNVNPY
ncbi:MAG: zinc ribbon domain-containing protein [Oscillospiraceae bacterium]|nr:zinc ribbon domain-containing protein [Oscillospiraceae bacterium]